MLVISAGMQKSGSAYIYNIINELLIHSEHADAREIKEKYHLEDMMNWHNNNIGNPTLKKLLKLLFISIREKAFCVKTHDGPSKWVKKLLALGLVKVIYSYRDPRDVYLSALDHGKKIVEKGENHTFALMLDQDKALNHLNSWVKIWQEYQKTEGILMIKYEDLLEKPHEIVYDILRYLNVKVQKEDLDLILEKYDRNNPNADKTGLHFNQARIERYKSELPEDVKILIESNFRREM